MTVPAIYEFRLRIDHARADEAERAEIEAELLAEFNLAFRPLADGVGVWEKFDKRRAVFKEAK